MDGRGEAPLIPDGAGTKRDVRRSMALVDYRMPAESKEADAARGLRRAKAYWLQTVQPYIKGRRLYGPELFVALDAHWRLSDANKIAKEWNDTKDGQASPIPPDSFADFETVEFREPEAFCRDENLKPEILAQIASPLLKDKWKELTPGEAILRAHEILIEAERHIAFLPLPNHGTESLIHDLEQGSSTVSFTEILQSSDEKSGRVPLLRGVSKKRAALSLPALKMAVSRFLERERENRIEISKKKWDQGRRQAGKVIGLKNAKAQTYSEWKKELENEINDILQNQRIPLQRLCDLRWQRFWNFWENQSTRRRKTAKAEEF